MFQTIANLCGSTRQTVYNWSNEQRPIISLLNKYFTKEELQEFLETGSIKKHELLKNIDIEDYLMFYRLKLEEKFKNISAEQGFWQALLKGERDKISSIILLHKILIKVDIKNLTLQNAKETLFKLIKDFDLSFAKKTKYVFPSKEPLINFISALTEMECFMILSNSQFIAEEILKIVAPSMAKRLKKDDLE